MDTVSKNCYAHSVYRHITPNGKSYIGQCYGDPNKRWQNGKGYEKQVFGKAVNKYNWENIKHIILETGLTQREANDKEREYIKLFNSLTSQNGYNVRPGVVNSSFSKNPDDHIGKTFFIVSLNEYVTIIEFYTSHNITVQTSSGQIFKEQYLFCLSQGMLTPKTVKVKRRQKNKEFKNI